MRFDIISIFPEMFSGYFSESILKRAVEAKILDIRVHDLRQWADDPHRKTDDKPYGGGPGMVMKVEPFFRALRELKAGSKKSERVILLCGRYEGVDERVATELADEELSIGDFVLTGGELPSMVVVDAVARQIPGVLGRNESLSEESHTEAGVVEYPQYTRPEDFSPSRGKHWKVPEVLLSGNHAEIERWRAEQRKKTPDSAKS